MMRNENGLTLVEVIAGVVILSIILISIFQFFTNAANFNATNDKNIQASNIVREYTANVTEQYRNLSETDLVNRGFVKIEDSSMTAYKKVENKDIYIVETIIYAKNDSPNGYRVLRPTKVVVWKEYQQGRPESESFTYQEGEVIQ